MGWHRLKSGVHEGEDVELSLLSLGELQLQKIKNSFGVWALQENVGTCFFNISIKVT